MIELRELAKHLGFEKLVLKNSSLMAYFPDEKKQGYYNSALFSGLLSFVQQNSGRCRMKQTSKNLILVVQHISGIAHAKKLLIDMQSVKERAVAEV
jgi:transcription-repair coupling factor (superfamily II helicase)